MVGFPWRAIPPRPGASRQVTEYLSLRNQPPGLVKFVYVNLPSCAYSTHRVTIVTGVVQPAPANRSCIPFHRAWGARYVKAVLRRRIHVFSCASAQRLRFRSRGDVGAV